MAKYVLIGGGEVGRGNTSYETKEIDEKIVALTEKSNPNFLFIGLASSFSDSYYDTMKKIYTSLGCSCQYLKKKNIINNPNIVQDKINNADIIYFCGGDTIKLLDDLKNYNIIKILQAKAKSNVILVGMSAGAIMLSKKGLSDCRMLRGETSSLEFISGLGFLDLTICPHYEKRKDELPKILKKEDKVYGLENNTALIIENSKIAYLKSQANANIYYCYYDNDKYITKKLF